MCSLAIFHVSNWQKTVVNNDLLLAKDSGEQGFEIVNLKHWCVVTKKYFSLDILPTNKVVQCFIVIYCVSRYLQGYWIRIHYFSSLPLQIGKCVVSLCYHLKWSKPVDQISVHTFAVVEILFVISHNAQCIRNSMFRTIKLTYVLILKSHFDVT